jgi:hypothetical protein
MAPERELVEITPITVPRPLPRKKRLARSITPDQPPACEKRASAQPPASAPGLRPIDTASSPSVLPPSESSAVRIPPRRSDSGPQAALPHTYAVVPTDSSAPVAMSSMSSPGSVCRAATVQSNEVMPKVEALYALYSNSTSTYWLAPQPRLFRPAARDGGSNGSGALAPAVPVAAGIKLASHQLL